VVGLLLAGIAAGSDLKIGFLLAGGITFLGCAPALFMKGSVGRTAVSRPALRNPSRHSEFSAGSPQMFYHHFTPKAFKAVFRYFRSPLGMFLVAWLISFGGAAAFFSLYPVLMKNAYGVDPSFSSICFAFAAAVGLLLYAPAGRWSRKYGPIKIIQTALGVRILAFTVLLALAALSLKVPGSAALVSVVFVVLAWSLLSVTGTEITAQYSLAHEGEGLGMFNASTSIAGVLGAVAGGWGAGIWGYKSVPAMGIGGAVVGMILMAALSTMNKNNPGKEN